MYFCLEEKGCSVLLQNNLFFTFVKKAFNIQCDYNLRLSDYFT